MVEFGVSPVNATDLQICKLIDFFFNEIWLIHIKKTLFKMYCLVLVKYIHTQMNKRLLTEI